MNRKLSILIIILTLVLQSFFYFIPNTQAESSNQVEDQEVSDRTEGTVEPVPESRDETTNPDTDSGDEASEPDSELGEEATNDHVEPEPELGKEATNDHVDLGPESEEDINNSVESGTDPEEKAANIEEDSSQTDSSSSEADLPAGEEIENELNVDEPLNKATKEISENIITSVVMKDGENGNLIQDIRPEQGSKVWIEYQWELPSGHTYSGGDTFTFSLPDKFKITQALSGNLDGGVGTYKVTPEGQVTFTFNDVINDGQELTNGYFYVWREFDESKFSGSLTQEIDFEHGASIIVHFQAKKGSSEMDKTGSVNSGMNPSEINWIVDVNKGEKSIDAAVFRDILPDGLKLETNSIEVYPLTVKLDGSVEQGTPITVTPNITEDGFTLDFGSIDSAYRVKYKTTLEPITIAPYQKTYANKATLSGTEKGQPYSVEKSANVPVKFSKPLDKKSTAYDSSTQTITWAIQYNYNEQTIKSDDAWVLDSYNKAHQELIDDSFKVYKMTVNADGSASRGELLEKDTDYTVDETVSEGFKLKFTSDISSAYEIEYETKAIGRVYDDSMVVKNTVEMYDGTKVNTNKTIGQVIFTKRVANVNYKDKTITWKLNLNQDNKEMTNVVITDRYSGQNMSLLVDSLEISSLVKDTDYKIGLGVLNNEEFVLSFTNPITTNHVITYKTKFDPTLPIPAGGYKNDATLSWMESGTEKSISKSATVHPDIYTQGNGNKTGKYNAQTKEITWTIDVNYNLHSINDAMVRDFYTANQTLVPNSLTVNHLNLTGGVDGVAVGEEVTDYTFNTKVEDGKEGFELNLGNIHSAYRITYKTSLENHQVVSTYSNHATLQDGGKGPFMFDKSATVQPKFGGEFINKTGSQGSGANAEFAYWAVNINRSQSIIKAGAKLSDTLSDNQILLSDSFKLYKTTVAVDGTLSKSADMMDPVDYTLKISGNTFTLTFNKELHNAYILEYTSYIKAADGEQITNDVSFVGRSTEAVNTGDNQQIIVEFSGAGGGAISLGKGNIRIFKINAATKLPLAGATFRLYDKSGMTLLETVVTDEKGEAVFKGYKYNIYKLKEESAPTGYVIADEYKDGKEISFTPDMLEIVIENRYSSGSGGGGGSGGGNSKPDTGNSSGENLNPEEDTDSPPETGENPNPEEDTDNSPETGENTNPEEDMDNSPETGENTNLEDDTDNSSEAEKNTDKDEPENTSEVKEDPSIDEPESTPEKNTNPEEPENAEQTDKQQKLPQTGEKQTNYMTIMGLLCMGAALLGFLIRIRLFTSK